MSRVGLGTIVSLALNIILSLWLINNYFYDEPFRNYVNITFGQIYPFFIVAIGVGGGSGLGYVLLRRRHPEESAASKLQKARAPRQSPLPPGGSLQGRGLASIASPAQTTKHTAYAVPPLPKSSPPGVQRGPPSFSWSGIQKPPMQGTPPSQRQEDAPTPGSSFQPSMSQSLKTETPTFPPPVSRIPPEPSSRPSPGLEWRPGSRPPMERTSEPGVQVRPPQQFPSKSGSPPAVLPPLSGQPQPVIQSRWPPSDSAGKPGQWVDPVPKQAHGPPPKWFPPGSAPGPPPPQAGMPPRPGGPFAPPRSPFAQPPPRPLAYPGAMRPSEGAGPSGPRPVRPDQPRPFQGGPPGPQVQGPRPSALPGGQPRSPPSGEKSHPSTSGSVEKPGGPALANEPHPPTSAPERKSGSEDAPSGEMDWDTALDTILKTLRKDKLGEK